MPDAMRTPRGDGPRMSVRARVIVPAVISFLVQVPASIWGVARVSAGVEWQGVLHVALAIAGVLALFWARRFPGPVVAAVAVFAAVDVLTTPVFGPPYIALAFAIVGAVVRGAAVWAAVAVAMGWAAVLLTFSFGGREWRPPVVVFATIGLAMCFAVGAFARTRRARFSAMREASERQRRSVEERERVRIARELHDVLGHALSQINVQAGVGLHLFDRDPEQARAALTHVKEASKLALDEVRGVLGVLRDGETPLTPEAGLGELPRLVAGAAGPGFETALDDRLDGALPDQATQLAAYRIVQEALTNVLRHSQARRVDVVVSRPAERMLQIAVADDGQGLTADSATAAGHNGIIGMQERASLLGGSVTVQKQDGRWRRGDSAPAVDSEPGEGVMIRVALADDQLLVRAGFRALLDSEPDIEVVVEAAGGRELLDSIRHNPVDVVLMDIRMPDGDGLWATEQIMADTALAGVHVVIVTTFELDEYVVRAVRAGAAGFLVKDTEPADLVRAVRSVAAGDGLLSPGVTRTLLSRMATGLREVSAGSQLDAITEREREVLRLVGMGLTNDEIAERLFLSPLTAKTHVSRIMSKLHARDRVHLVVVAYETGLVSPGWQ